MEQGIVTILVHCILSHCQKHAYQVWSHLGLQCMMTKLRSRQEMLYKINQRGIIQKQNKVELRFLCNALQVIARSMHTTFGVIWTYDDKVTLRTRKARRRGRGHGRRRRRRRRPK